MQWSQAWALASRSESALQQDEAEALWHLGHQVGLGRWAVEIGAYKGRSTVALGLAIREAGGTLASVDPHQPWDGCGGPVPASWAHYRDAIAMAGLDGPMGAVKTYRCTSAEAATRWPGHRVSLLWIDGDHSYDGAMLDWRSWLPHLAPDALVAWHDYTAPAFGVRQAVDELVAGGCLEHIALVRSLYVARRTGSHHSP